MNDKLTRLSAWIGRDDERREREREFPRALCRVCGGWAKAGEGSRDEAPAAGLLPHPFRAGVVMTPRPVNAPRDADGWRRECATCATSTMAELVGAVVGVEVSESDASKVVRRMKNLDPDDINLTVTFPTAQTTGDATGKPWGHLRKEHRGEVKLVLGEVIRERQIGPCRQGACGMCGCRESLRWYEGPRFLKWSDGSPAPVCRECQEVLTRRPEVSNIEQLRVVGIEASTGFSQIYFDAPPAFRLYFESTDSDGNGHAQPWSYSSGIIAFREEMWTDHPHLAPEERGDEFTQRLRARIAESKREALANTESQLAW